MEENLDKFDWPPADAYYSSNQETDYDQKIAEAVLNIYDSAEEHEKRGSSEAAWNSMVHETLFQLIAKHPKYKGAIGCENM